MQGRLAEGVLRVLIGAHLYEALEDVCEARRGEERAEIVQIGANTCTTALELTAANPTNTLLSEIASLTCSKSTDPCLFDGLTQKMQLKMDTQCTQLATAGNDIGTDIENELTQTFEKDSKGFDSTLVGDSNTINRQEIINDFKKVFSNENVMESVNEMKQMQVISGKNMSMSNMSLFR